MNPINPFEDEFHCHSKFRPPEIEVVEFKARRVWPDWDDFPPYQDQNNVSIRKDAYANTNERTKKRYNMEIKKTQNEIEEMTKRFRNHDYYSYEPKNRVANGPQSYDFFQTNVDTGFRNQSKYANNVDTGFRNQSKYAYSAQNDNNYYSSFTNNYRSLNNNDDQYESRFSYNYNIGSNAQNYNNNSYYQSQQLNISNHSFSNTQGSFSQSFSKNDKKGEDVDYEITAAATLEAGLLREQNEAMRKRINYLKQKLEAQKNENRVVLKKIEASEIDRHKMVEYLSNSQVKKMTS